MFLNSTLPFLFAQATPQSTFIFIPPLLWLILGIIFCLLELILPKTLGTQYRLIALIMGVSALIVSFILWRAGIALSFQWQFIMYEGLNLQIIYWMVLSLASIIWLRPMFLTRKKFTIPEATEATTLTEILPGKMGRVLYEGSSWQASCNPSHGAIACGRGE